MPFRRIIDGQFRSRPAGHVKVAEAEDACVNAMLRLYAIPTVEPLCSRGSRSRRAHCRGRGGRRRFSCRSGGRVHQPSTVGNRYRKRARRPARASRNRTCRLPRCGHRRAVHPVPGNDRHAIRLSQDQASLDRGDRRLQSALDCFRRCSFNRICLLPKHVSEWSGEARRCRLLDTAHSSRRVLVVVANEWLAIALCD